MGKMQTTIDGKIMTDAQARKAEAFHAKRRRDHAELQKVGRRK